MWLADTNFPSEKTFEVENFQLLTMIFFGKFSVHGNFSWVEMGLKALFASTDRGREIREENKLVDNSRYMWNSLVLP
jgi:hypothetical protein